MDNIFESLIKTTKKFGEKITENVSKIGDNIAADQKELIERERLYGCLWEPNENVAVCRSCAVRFTPLEPKKHCRGCAGIFCETCTIHDLSDLDSGEFLRGCEGT
jgi:hypothetical protein